MSIGNARMALMALALIAAAFAPRSAIAGPMTRDDFVFPADQQVKIVVFRPDVHVGSFKVGGLDEPNADWTQAARTNIQTAMQAAGEVREANMQFLGDFEGADGELVNEYRSLFETVAGAAFQHITLGDNLQTKLAPKKDPANPKERKRYRLDWTLGDRTSRLNEVTGGDYGLFFFTHDSYGDAGRKVAQLLMAGLFGVAIAPGIHIGYAGLVDLKTGNLVWFNSDIAMGGDPRDVEGAQKRVRQLLAGFPKRGIVAAPTGELGK